MTFLLLPGDTGNILKKNIQFAVCKGHLYTQDKKQQGGPPLLVQGKIPKVLIATGIFLLPSAPLVQNIFPVSDSCLTTALPT